MYVHLFLWYWKGQTCVAGDSPCESPKAKTEVSGVRKDSKPLRDVSPENVVPREAAAARVIGILPGIGVYSNSSESDSSSSDSEIDTDLLRRSVAKEVEKMIQAAHQHWTKRIVDHDWCRYNIGNIIF